MRALLLEYALTLYGTCRVPERRCISQAGNLNKPWRQRQRESHQTKGLMSKTIAVHVRYKSLFISMPSSANNNFTVQS